MSLQPFVSTVQLLQQGFNMKKLTSSGRGCAPTCVALWHLSESIRINQCQSESIRIQQNYQRQSASISINQH